jgi:parvulin-like peptidyl-prolyl isomerase
MARHLPPRHPGWLFALGAALLLTGCDQPAPQANDSAPAPPPEVVARVGETVITRSDLESELPRTAADRTPAEVLESLIEFQAALAKARAEGYDREPDVTAAIQRLIVDRYREAQRERLSGSAPEPPLTDAAIEASYREQAARFMLPTRARGAVIRLTNSPKASAEQQAQLRQEAAALLESARLVDSDGFAELARQHSTDQATRHRGGDTGWIREDEAYSRWDPAVRAALFALEQPGDTAPLIETAQAFHIVRLLELVPPGLQPLEEVRAVLQAEWAREAGRRREAELRTALKTGLVIEINTAVLEQISRPPPPVPGTPPALPGP